MGLYIMKDLKDEEKKEALESFVKKNVILTFSAWQKRIEANSSKDFFVGDNWTLADICLLTVYANSLAREPLKEPFEKILESFPTLKAYFETRFSSLKDYFDNRPDCVY
mmetsp:Transcript_826/g.781  ORF Transcript_826/g.781 Transcript_826/m.781 type:complete len:109 (-) Transcript_826:26-352(-)